MHSDDPAFPRSGTFDFGPQTGMTKRQYFAGLAMQSLILAKGSHVPDERLAEQAVQLADALIAALSNTPSPT